MKKGVAEQIEEQRRQQQEQFNLQQQQRQSPDPLRVIYAKSAWSWVARTLH